MYNFITLFDALQEVRVKQFKQQLEHVLDEFYTVQGSINHLIQPLLVPHIEGCVRSLLPGCTTLTWSSMNIDAFLYRVNTSVASLKMLVEKVDSILKLRVYKILDGIASSSLFDLELATSKAWVRLMTNYHCPLLWFFLNTIKLNH